MIARLPRWVEYGSFLLAMIAGYVNAIGLLGVSHQAISHLSGSVTRLATSLANVDLLSAFHLVMVLLSFLLGATISGFFLRSGALKLGRHYSRLLLLEGLFLFAAMQLLKQDLFYGHYLASAACGLQNAMVTTYSGAVVRTTHVTGIFTDLGLMLGAKLRGQHFDGRRALLFLLIIAGFTVGGGVGGYLFVRIGFNALLLPVFTCLCLAQCYSIYSARLETQRYLT